MIPRSCRVIRAAPAEVSLPGPHPRELRERVLAAYENGEGSFDELGKRFRVGEASVNRWVALKRETGGVAPRPMGGSRGRLMDAEGEKFVHEWIGEVCTITMAELADVYAKFRGVRMSEETMRANVERLGYTKKKGRSGRWQRTARTSSARGKRSSRR